MTRLVAMSLEGRRLDDGQGNYAQAAGTGQAYVIEIRQGYGEGFAHWRAATQGQPSEQRAKVYFRHSCPRGRHPPRRCPITVDATQVMSLDSAAASMLTIHASGDHCDLLAWHDVTRGFRADPVDDEDRLEVRDMRPEASQ